MENSTIVGFIEADVFVEDSDPWYGPVRSYVKIFEEYEYSILIAAVTGGVIFTLVGLCCSHCCCKKKATGNSSSSSRRNKSGNTTIVKDEIVTDVYSTGLKVDPIFQLPEDTGDEFEEENERFLGGSKKAGEATEMQSNNSTTSKRSTRSTGSQTVTINNAVTPPVAASFTVATASASTPKFEQKKKKELIPIVPIAPITMRAPELPTSPQPKYSPTISPASSIETIFDNVEKPNNKRTVKHNIAFSSLPRRLFPLSSELLTFLAKEDLNLDWQIYTINNRALECFLYKYMIFITEPDRENLLVGIMLTRILIQIQARDAENELENVKQNMSSGSDSQIHREAWSVSKTCPISFGSFCPRRNLLLDFEKIVPNVKGLLLSKGICGLTHLEQIFGNPEKSVELMTSAESHVLSGDITVQGMDSLLRLLDGFSQDAAMYEFVKAQEDWEIKGGNAVEPMIVKNSIKTSVSISRSSQPGNGLYQFAQTSTKADLSMRRRFEVSFSNKY
ncbi:Oidioi.mRNA.OKI2018_I69.XSR.g13614.t1.cds [Oikopleura dioica]|uniref:Oidioi.mRNA.OKI2018_I69.XSR.g13614.t1.cds n=1 Tax=Oikopleura dioica TaxID=34765 RepID=A0ABN7SB94_OIKDI|nr:Oidioi.mRNA.OKI2018_I69.XSR.g13614.t1.cds [Oikopleura dioica]